MRAHDQRLPSLARLFAPRTAIWLLANRVLLALLGSANLGPSRSLRFCDALASGGGNLPMLSSHARFCFMSPGVNLPESAQGIAHAAQFILQPRSLPLQFANDRAHPRLSHSVILPLINCKEMQVR